MAWLVWHFTHDAEAVRLYATQAMLRGGARGVVSEVVDAAAADVIERNSGQRAAQAALRATRTHPLVFLGARTAAETQVVKYAAEANAKGVAISTFQIAPWQP